MILNCSNAQNIITAQQTILKSQWTIGQGWLGLGISREGAVPKEIEEGGKHYIQYIVGFQNEKDGIHPIVKNVPLEFDLPALFKLDSDGFKCFGKYIGFDEAHYKAKKPAAEQMGSYHAEFMQDQLLEISDAVVEQLKAKGASKATYDDLKAFTQGDEVDASALAMNFASWQGIKEALENDRILTTHHLIADHDAVTDLALQKGALICRVEDWGRKFYMSDKVEYKILCEKPANLAEMAVAADKNLPAGAWKVTPSGFASAAQQMKVLGLKPSGLKEAGDAFEVMPGAPQAVLDATGYRSHKAVSNGMYWGVPAALLGVAALTGVVGFVLGRKGRKPAGGETPADAKTPKKTTAPKSEPAKETKSVKDTTEPAQKPAAPEKKRETKPAPVEAVEDEMEDVLKHLDEAKKDQSAPAKPLGLASAVTADNILIRGAKAEPVSGVDPDVLRIQVLLHYRKFLSRPALAALESGNPVASGTPLVAPSFENDVPEIVDRLVNAYHDIKKSEALSDLWKSQLDQRGYIVRRGAPQRLLLEVVSAYIEERSKEANSPFAGGVGAEIRSEAEKNAGETTFFEDGLRDLMKHMGR